MRILKSFLGFFAIVAISTISFELLAYLFIEKGSYVWRYRYLFVSQGAYRPLPDKLWTYRPNDTIEYAATYMLPGWSDPKIEYHCTLETNGLGFTKTANDELDNIDFLVMGDSYTEGHGGCSWLNTSSTESLNRTYFNAGAQSYGIWQMDKTRKYLEETKNFGNLIIFAISDDFIRPLSNQWIIDQAACLQNLECEFGKVFWWTTENFTKEHLFEITHNRHNYRHNSHSYSDIFQFYLKKYSFLYEIVTRALGTYNSTENNQDVARFSEGGVFSENLQALLRLRKDYPDMKLILIPQRDELRFGFRNNVTLVLLEHLDANNFNYDWCELTPSDYMPLDGHPNEVGYQKMMACLTAITEPQS